ncbi:MAG TPA: trehalose-6-phosphate synthase [Candidatus Manganitrophaceae bacterium]|nr:trehalose-6-phosphate synthase [Candidatus Manganitrophaceae bacterium]
MKISLRLILALLIVLGTIVGLFTLNQIRVERQRLIHDLDRRASLLAESLQETLGPALVKRNDLRLRRIVEKFGNRERLAGIAIFDLQGVVVAATQGLAAPSELLDARPSLLQDQEKGFLITRGDRLFHIYATPLLEEDQILGTLALIHDAAYIPARLVQIWKESFIRLLTYAGFIALTTLLVVRWSIEGPIARMAEWMKQLRLGNPSSTKAPLQEALFKPLAFEVTRISASLTAARASAEQEAKLRHASESLWTPERLKEFVRNRLKGRSLFVVSNREPYIHTKRGKAIECVVPASGLVTALEPIMRACEGLWIAHGSGDADMATVDARDHVRVPPDDPAYTLKRVWLTKEEEEGYYYGFSNEGLWPLCHIAHTRPLFRRSDWEAYQAVNIKFADALLDELRGTTEPLVLIQDYHFALLPRLIKQARPDARVGLFWHIPWPNPEAFAICPWQREILQGILGADLIGFHIQFHCNNFLETVDRALECRIDRERFSAMRDGHQTVVKPFPISVAPWQFFPPSNGNEREQLLKEAGLPDMRVGVGVDRLDYTKGILERFRGLERFFEKYPSFREQFVFVELGAPSRTHIPRYHDLVSEIDAEVERINWRFRSKTWAPILFLKRHHSHEEIHRWYRIADLCLVTSLHDGMNLVAKEYVTAKEDGRGALILSAFTGAAREFLDALIVNPYDTEQVADATRYALEMSDDEQNRRMEAMRLQARDYNVYRWAAALVEDLAQVRVTLHERPLP